jgi:hypothetical protein
MLKIKDMEDIYPLTIVSDRYSGAYSGGQYLAFNLYPDNVPRSVGGEDMEEGLFWDDGGEHEKYIIGKGETPNAAADDLAKKLKAAADA